MNYDNTNIVVELLAKVKILEKRVKRMEKRLIEEGVFDEDDAFGDDWDIELSPIPPEPTPKTSPRSKKVSTEDIRAHIERLIVDARGRGEPSITLVARDLHGELGLSSKYPMVCNAMRQCMRGGDVVIFSPPSGYSSTLKIKYFT